MKLVVRIIEGTVVTAFIFILFGMQMGFRTTDKGVRRHFAKRDVGVKIQRIPYEGDSLRWIETGLSGQEAPLLVFVHGAPGSSNNFFRYLSDSTLRARARMLSIDRPGYGYSAYGRSETSIARQAEALKAILDHVGSGRKAILVGHSFGGPIVAKAAVDHPDQAGSILMLAPVNDPAHEQIFWFSHLARWKATRWMLSPAWKVAGDEKFGHAAALGAITPAWASLRLPVIHLHGEKDILAPPANADFSEKNIPAGYLRLLRLPDAGHLIPFMQYETTKKEILRILDQQP